VEKETTPLTGIAVLVNQQKYSFCWCSLFCSANLYKLCCLGKRKK